MKTATETQGTSALPATHLLKRRIAVRKDAAGNRAAKRLLSDKSKNGMETERLQ
jgi:hypothetical protein